MDIAKTVSFGLAATLLLGVARFDFAVAQDAPVAPVAEVAPVMAPMEGIIAAQTRAAAAEADRVKARADRVAAQAKARAAAETDPAKREQYRQEAEQVAVQSAKVKAQADLAAAQYAAAARQHMGLAFQLAEEVRQKALADLARAEMDQQRMKLAQTMPPSGGHAESSASGSDSVTINGATYSGNVTVKQGQPGAPITITADKVTADLPPPNDASQARMVNRYSRTSSGVHIDAQVDTGVAEVMNHPEVATAIQEAVRTAMVEASKKIDAAIAQAKAKTGLPPVAPVLPVPPR